MDAVIDNLKQLGFYKFQLATDNELEGLRSLYAGYMAKRKQANTGMSVSHNHGNPDEHIELSKSIEAVLKNSIGARFPGYRVFISHFAVKAANCEHSFQLHRDWNIVDEAVEQSIQLWIPLDLSYPENGGLCFVPRSHLFDTNYRSGSFGLPLVGITPLLHPYLSYIRLFPGEAVAFYNNLLHGSFSNATDTDRVAVLVNLVPEKSRTCYFHLNQTANTVELYEVDAPTLLQHLPMLEKGALPFSNPVATMPTSQTKQANELLNDEAVVAQIIQDRNRIGKPGNYEFKQDPIIRNEQYEQEINEVGYTVIDFLDETHISQLKSEFTKFFPDRSKFKGRYNSLDNLDDSGRRQAHNFIITTIQHQLDALFKDYLCPISVLYSKRNDGVADTDWHTDPHFVFNQHLEPLYSIWCPLQDVDDTSGVLNVIPYSHRLSYKITNPNYTWDLEEGRGILNKYRKTFHLKAGQAIFFDSRLIHGSPPNVSDIQRDCIVLRVAHKQASFVSITPGNAQQHFYDVHRHDAEFFMGNTVKKHHEKPNTGILAGTYRHFSQPRTINEIVKTLENIHENTEPKYSYISA